MPMRTIYEYNIIGTYYEVFIKHTDTDYTHVSIIQRLLLFRIIQLLLNDY